MSFHHHFVIMGHSIWSFSPAIVFVCDFCRCFFGSHQEMIRIIKTVLLQKACKIAWLGTSVFWYSQEHACHIQSVFILCESSRWINSFFSEVSNLAILHSKSINSACVLRNEAIMFFLLILFYNETRSSQKKDFTNDLKLISHLWLCWKTIFNHWLIANRFQHDFFKLH